jgi:hypothetical protein
MAYAVACVVGLLVLVLNQVEAMLHSDTVFPARFRQGSGLIDQQQVL